MIQSFQVINENQDAFISLMCPKNRFSTRIKKDATPEGMANPKY
jgi:hypothetical protein